MMHDLRFEDLELCRAWKVSVQQKVGNLEEARLFRKLFNGIASVP